MATPPHVIQLLPHISDAIAETLTFADLINCVRVNHAWHEAFSKFLYEDVITFRSKQTRPGGNWDGHEYFISPISCLSFARYSHHIRGLTCQARQLANILLKTPTFDSLIEINFILDENTTSGNCDTIFNPLTELITRSPHLQAVSVENVDFRSMEQLRRLRDFAEVLDQYPAITCVYFDGGKSFDLSSVIVRHFIGQIWSGLWARVSKDTSDAARVRTLAIQRSELLSRSNRGPKSRGSWTSREQPLRIQVPETNLWREINYSPVGGLPDGRSGGGRWEDEVWTKLPTIKNVIAVIHRPKELHLVCDDSFLNDDFVIEMMHRYRRHCREFLLGPWNIHHPGFWTKFPGVFPNLERYDLNYMGGCMRGKGLAIAESSRRLTSYRFVRPTSHCYLKLGLKKHWRTLVEVDLDVMDFPMKIFWKLLANAPKLQSVRIPVVLIDGFEPTELPEWATVGLDKLSIGLCLEGHERDLMRGTSSPQPESEPQSANNPVEAAQWIGPLLMAQINSQPNLHQLELSFNHRRRLRRSPIFALSLDPDVGLPQLSNLKQLERFVVSGLVHRMGKEEMVWIARTWPRLTSIEVPVVHQWKDNDEALSKCRRFFTGEESELQQWGSSRLKVVTPFECYSCGRCTSIYCACRTISTDLWDGEHIWNEPNSDDDDDYVGLE